MTYTPTKWVNGGKPAINAENLNKIEEALARLSVPDITETTSTTQPNSYAGRENILEIGGGESEQDSTAGKNLLENIANTGTKNGVTFTVNADKSVTVNGTNSGTSHVYYSFGSINLIAGQEYVLSGCPSGGASDKYFMYFDGVSGAHDVGNGKTYTPTENETRSIGMCVRSGVTVSNLVFYPMIRLSSVTDATYEPFTNGPAPNPSYPMEIKKSVVKGIRTHWKNFLNLSTDRMNKLTYANGIYTSKPCGAWAMLQVYLINGVKMRVGKKYYLKAKIRRISGSGEINTFALEPAKTRKMVNIPNLTDSFQEYVAELYVDSDSVANTVCTIQPNGTAIDLVLEIKDIILCEDLEAEYQPYTESSYTFSQPIDLYGMNGVQDVITPKNGTLVVERKIGRYEIQNNLEWAISTNSASGVKRFYFIFKAMKYFTQNVLCNYATNKVWNVMEKTLNCCGTYEQYFGLTLDTTQNFTTSAEMNSYIASLETPIEVTYELATPTTEALPIADQIALNSLATYDGITYVEFDSEIQPTFKAEYGTSKVGGYTLEAMLAGRNGELRG